MGFVQKSATYLHLACQTAIYLKLNYDPDELIHFKHEKWIVKEIRRRVWNLLYFLDKCIILVYIIQI